MLDSLFYWTGVVVWLNIVVYVLPALPLLVLGVQYKILQKIEGRWSDRYYEDIDEYREKRDEGWWPTRVSVMLAKMMRGADELATSYQTVVGQYYYRFLPLT